MFAQSAIKKQKIAFSEILAMTPAQMAQGSTYTQNAYEYIIGKINKMKTPFIKEQISDMFFNSALTFMKLYDDAEKRKLLREQFIEKGYLYPGIGLEQFMPQSKVVPPIWVAAGSGYRGHHAHPGGLVIHIEENLRLSLYLAKMYKEMYGLSFDKDMIIFSQVAHDLSKAWIANWQPDGSLLLQYGLADTGAHHIFALAESIYRDIPPQFLYCQAATHVQSTSKSSRDVITGFLRAAFLVAQKDPQKYGLFDNMDHLAFDYRREEFWFVNMGDQMLFTVSELRRCTKVLQELMATKYGFSESDLVGRRFNQVRNYLFCQCSVAGVFDIIKNKGVKGLQELVEELIEF